MTPGWASWHKLTRQPARAAQKAHFQLNMRWPQFFASNFGAQIKMGPRHFLCFFLNIILPAYNAA
jgi:hypothetical protein